MAPMPMTFSDLEGQFCYLTFLTPTPWEI